MAGLRIVAIGLAHQHARQGHADEPRILGFLEALPALVLRLPQHRFQVKRQAELVEGFQAEQLGRRTDDGGREGGGGDLRQPLEAGHVVGRPLLGRAMLDGVVAQQHAEGAAAGHAELVAVDLVEQLALVELDGAFLVAAQFGPGQVEQAQHHRLGVLRLLHQRAHPAPGAFQRLEALVVQDGVDLFGQQRVDRRDVAVEGGAQLVQTVMYGKRDAEPQPQRLPGAIGRQEGIERAGIVAAERHVDRPQTQRPFKDRCLRVVSMNFGRCLGHAAISRPAGCGRPCAWRWSVPPSAATGASRRRRCRSRACPGSPSPAPWPRPAGTSPSSPGPRLRCR